MRLDAQVRQLQSDTEELRDGDVSAIGPRVQVILAAERWRTALANGGLLVLLALITMTISLVYVSHERYFYYWDLANFHNLTSTTALAFRQSPYWAMRGVLESLANDYNALFTIPLLPFILTFGDSRLVYVLSVALVYLLPFALVMGAIGTKVIPLHRRAVFWSAAFLTLLTPMAWAPTLYGWPDTGAALLIALAVWVYLHDIRLKRYWQIVLIGFCIAAAALFRRYFAYAGVAFFISITLQALIAFFGQARQLPREAFRNLYDNLVRICLTGVATLLVLAVLGWPFLYKALTRDYGVHASYVRPFSDNLWFYASQHGWAAWMLAWLGLAAGVKSRVLARPAATFIALFGGVSLVQWLCTVRQLGTQYTLQFTLVVVLGLTAFGWATWVMSRGMLRTLAASAAVVYIALNFMIGLAPSDLLQDSILSPLFAARYPPLVRADYEEIGRLIRYLRTLASHKEATYVVASSYDFNWDLLRNAERTLYGRDQSVLNILETQAVDSRHSYPLQSLLRAQYVLVATPLQHHLRAEQQQLVKVAFVAFTENWEIAQDFTRLPEQFQLANGAMVNIYQRTRATSLKTALRTLEAMQNFMGPRPRGKLDWMVLNDSFGSSIGKTGDGTFRIRTRIGRDNGSPMTWFLYLGMLPEHITTTGVLTPMAGPCSEIRIAMSALTPEARIVDAVESTYHPTDTAAFSLKSNTKGAAYLLLSVSSADGGESDHSCSLRIDRLAVSGK